MKKEFYRIRWEVAEMENRQVFFYSRALFWGFGLSLILNTVGSSFWISELIGLVIGFAILYFLKDVNPPKWIKTSAGIILTFIATAILVNLGGTLYLRSTPNLLLGGAPLLAAFVMSKSKNNSMKRTLFILFMYSMFMSITAAGILSSYARIENVLPIEIDVVKIIKGALIFVLSSVAPVVCLNDFKDKKSLLLNYTLSMVCVIAISILTVTVLGSQEAMLYRYPEYALLKRVKIYEFFTYVDNIYFVIMIADLIIMMSYGLKNGDLKGKIKPLIPVVFICMITSYVCTHSYLMTFFYTYFPFLLFFLLVVTLFPKR